MKLNRRAGRWEAQIKAAGKLVYLGMYDEEGEAAEAYDQATIAVRVRCARLAGKAVTGAHALPGMRQTRGP